jgi:hypothetical protein
MRRSCTQPIGVPEKGGRQHEGPRLRSGSQAASVRETIADASDSRQTHSQHHQSASNPVSISQQPPMRNADLQ